MTTPDRELEAPDPGDSVIDQLSHEEAAYVAGALFDQEEDYWKLYYDDPFEAIEAMIRNAPWKGHEAEELAKETIALSRQRNYAEKRAREINNGK